MKPEIYDIDQVEVVKRKSPASRMIESIDGEYKIMRQVANELNVSIETLRRLCKTDKVKAPSKAMKRGQLVIYLFTPEDEKEVRDYFEGRINFLTDAPIHANNKDGSIG